MLYRDSILCWIRKRPALFTLFDPFFLIGIILLGMGKPSSSTPWLSPIAASISYACILLGGFHVHSTKVERQAIFRHILPSCIIATAIQFFWLTSHLYAYMWFVWPILSFLLSVPLAFFLSAALFEIIHLLSEETEKQFSLYQIRLHLFFCLISLSLVAYESFLANVWPNISFFTSSLMFIWYPASAQLASYFGRESLSFIIYLTNLEGAYCFILISYLWKHRICIYKRRALIYSVICWLFLTLAPYLSSLMICHDESQEKRLDLRAVVLHMEEEPNIFQTQLKKPWDIVTTEWKKLLKALDQAHITQKSSYDIIAIPEGSIPYPSDAIIVNLSDLQASYPELIRSTAGYSGFLLNETKSNWGTSLDTSHTLANTLQTHLMIALEGIVRDECPYDEVGNPSATAFNSAFFVRPNISMSNRYDKQLLIPFGEYIPFVWLKDFLSLYGVHGSFTPGLESKVYKLPLKTRQRDFVYFSPLICYEETFSKYGIGCRKKGAEFIISLNNDVWFPSKRLAKEHFQLAQLQAIELKIPIIRSTNMGMSGVIDENGNSVLSYLGSKKQENIALTATISVRKDPPLSFYVKTYRLRNIIAIIAIIAGWSLYLMKRLYSRS